MKMPPFIGDVYADLRDRRLLPLAGILVVAIVAVPLLLSAEPETVPPAASDASAALDVQDVPTLPAVLASDPGLRDYRQRLRSLRSKNPFAQHFEAPKVKGATVENVGAPETLSESVASAGGGAETSAATSEGGSSTEASESVSASASTETVTKTTEVEQVLVRHDLDASVKGPGGDRRFDDVEELETLPGKKTPLVVYLGVTADEKEAVFMVSRDVVGGEGDGRCSPAPSDCQLLRLGAGKQRKLDYVPDGGEPVRYVLKVHEIKRVVEKLD